MTIINNYQVWTVSALTTTVTVTMASKSTNENEQWGKQKVFIIIIIIILILCSFSIVDFCFTTTGRDVLSVWGKGMKYCKCWFRRCPRTCTTKFLRVCRFYVEWFYVSATLYQSPFPVSACCRNWYCLAGVSCPRTIFFSFQTRGRQFLTVRAVIWNSVNDRADGVRALVPQIFYVSAVSTWNGFTCTPLCTRPLFTCPPLCTSPLFLCPPAVEIRTARPASAVKSPATGTVWSVIGGVWRP